MTGEMLIPMRLLLQLLAPLSTRTAPMSGVVSQRPLALAVYAML